jgi:L-threonylcarbamoyladenylate synthase
VLDDFNGKIPLILDGGVSTGGIESTVCDVTGEIPVILRPGLVTKEMIEEVCGACGVYTPTLKAGERVKSPGVLYKNYSPRCKTFLFKSEEVELALKRAKALQESGMRVAVLCESLLSERFLEYGITVLDLGDTPERMASNLYGLLREAERIADELIAVEPIEQNGVMAGVMKRPKKACLSVDIPHE